MTQAAPRTALVVGGSGGIGGAVAAQLAGAGYRVVTTRRHPQACDTGMLPLDITDLAACQARAAEIAARFGSIHALVNCASIALPGLSGPFEQADPHRFAAATHASVSATLQLVHSMAPLFGTAGGAILLFASDAALFAARHQAIVGSTRAAIVGFTRNYAMEAAARGVRVNCVSLTYVRDTPIFERLERDGSARIAAAAACAGLGLPTPGDVAPLAAFLCSDAARRITGQVISVNGGLNA